MRASTIELGAEPTLRVIHAANNRSTTARAVIGIGQGKLRRVRLGHSLRRHGCGGAAVKAKYWMAHAYPGGAAVQAKYWMAQAYPFNFESQI